MVVSTCRMFRLALVSALFALALSAQSEPDARSLEARGETEFSARNCAAAAKTYSEAAAQAEASGETARTGFYYRRIGICKARLGDLDGALDAYLAGTKAGELSGDGEMLEENIHGAALSLQKLGRLDEAMPLAQREYELTKKCGHPEHLVRAMWLVSDFENLAGRTRVSVELLEGAIRISRSLNDRASTAILLDDLAIRYFGMGDAASAVAMEKEVVTLLDPRNTSALAITWGNLGEMQQSLGERSEASKSFATALELATTPESRSTRVAVMTNRAKLYLDAGDYSRAESESGQALDLVRQLTFPLMESGVERFRAEMYLAEGVAKLSDAARSASSAVELGRRAGSSQRTYEALLSRGRVQDALGHHPEARADFDAAIAITAILRAETPGGASDLGGAFESIVPLYRSAVQNLLDLQLPGEALQRAEEAKARVLMDILLRGGVDERSSLSATELATRNGLRRSLASANSKALDHPSPEGTWALETAASRLRQFERDVYERHPELALQSANFQAAGASQLVALLGNDRTALLDYFSLPSGIALFVVRKSGTRAFVLQDPEHTIAAQIHRFRVQLASRDFDYREAARHLFDLLIAPALPALGTTTEWIVSPDGALWEMPFAALVDPAGHHLLETRSIALVPSLTAAIRLRERNQSAAPGEIRLLAVGNPLPSDSPLPDAAVEARSVGAGIA